MWDAEAMRGLPDGSAGLPRRCAPRNDRFGLLAREPETDAEAQTDVAIAGRDAAAPGGAQVRPGAVPGATAPDPGRARCRTLGVGQFPVQMTFTLP